MQIAKVTPITLPDKGCPAKWSTVRIGAGMVFAAVLLAACASFPAERLPKVDQAPSKSQASNKPSVYLPLRFVFDLSGGEKPGVEVAGPLPNLRKLVEKVVTEGELFRSYTFESFQAKDVDYVVQLEMLNYGSAGKAVAAGLITGFTLFIVPTAATDNFRLTAKVFDRNGQLLKTSSYEDAVTTWFGIWLLPMVGKTPESTTLAVWENMIRTLFRDIVNDGILPYSRLDPQSRILTGDLTNRAERRTSIPGFRATTDHPASPPGL